MPAASNRSLTALRDALCDPAAYPHAPDRVELKQTHISLVALVPPRVYKLKKPLDLGFLDFSTLEARWTACEREVQLNRRLAPSTYEAVVPVVDTPDGLRVDPEDGAEAGEVVEYAVRMRYLDPEHFLDHQLDQGAVSRADIDRVAQTLCTFYEERSSTPTVAEAGWIDALRTNVDENFEQTVDFVGSALSRPTYEALRYYTDRFFDQHAALFHRRRAGGFIVDGHGDLRLEHVHLTDEQVRIYDCIEFNDRFRHLDVANDVAFLAMDLDRSGHPAFARRLVERVAAALGDPHMHELMPFYKSYRAFIRGKVDCLRAAEDEVPAAERDQSRQRAQQYFQWALRYAVGGDEPLVLVVFGRPGTGKSTQAAALADALGWTHVASDRVRKRQAGVPLDERTDPETRERLYTDEMSDRTYGALRDRAVERGRAGESTVLDATYSGHARRETLRTALRAADLPAVFVELTAPDDVLRARLASRDAATATASDARAEDFEALSARYEAPSALEDPRHIRVDTERSPPETTLAILKALIRLND